MSSSVVDEDAGKAHCINLLRKLCSVDFVKMPCRKANYIFLEQSVTVDSKEVDALVTKIGEALQLHNNSANQTKSCLHNLASSGGGGVKQSTSSTTGVPRRSGCCVRLRNRNVRSRASPYHIPGSSDQEWEHFKTWNRKEIDVSSSEDDPHQLLQELILSGNLIKEAVRRLQFSSEMEHQFSKQID